MPGNRTILVVDDEPDVLETIEEVLEDCTVETAGSYRKAVQLLEVRTYDMVILDVMGVKGLELLDLAVQRGFPAVMLTGPALTPEFVLEAEARGAASYLPKQALSELDVLLDQIFELIDEGQRPWQAALERLEPLLQDRFGPDWRNKIQKP